MPTNGCSTVLPPSSPPLRPDAFACTALAASIAICCFSFFAARFDALLEMPDEIAALLGVPLAALAAFFAAFGVAFGSPAAVLVKCAR